MSTVYIFGGNHFLQGLDPVCLTATGLAAEQDQKTAFYGFLREIIAQRVELIAEEAKNEKRCVGSMLGRQSGVAFMNITMPLKEREKHGIKTPEYDQNE